MRVHHLNCGSMCPFGRRLINGEGPLLERGRMVAHVLLVEGNHGLTLVDTGFGTQDVRERSKRLGAAFLAMTGARLREEETALRQVERLGFKASDVRHIAVTHLDVDHAGGLADFPDAEVHVFRAEHEAAMRPSWGLERERYRKAQWAHGPRWKVHDVDGDRFLGFPAVKAIGDEVLLVPMVGHTRGHVVVAVKDGPGHLLHCGDAYFAGTEMDERPSCPAGLSVFQKVIAWDDKLRQQNQARLRELIRSRPAEITAFSAHCPTEFDRITAARAVAS
jgi:glyoxylase-like metal-dependent hydrolase (beta-lactamase superfamily II)